MFPGPLCRPAWISGPRFFARFLFAALPVVAAPAWAQTAGGPAEGSTPNPSFVASGPAMPTEETTVLSSFVVTSSRDEGYRSTQSVLGSRTVENLRDTPTSISILNRELMDDLNIATVNELMAFAIAGEHDPNTEGPNAQYVFRGQVSNITLRNGVPWLQAMDAHSIERAEILRGPQAFLYGEGNVGGMLNQVTKQAKMNNTQNLALMGGSYGMHRAEVDVNRRLSNTLAARVSLVYQSNDSFIDHVSRQFKGAYLALTYQPFRDTTFTVNGEYGRTHEVRATNLLGDQYANTLAFGTSAAAYVNTTGGNTWVPALGQVFNYVGQRRSVGTGISVTNESILPRQFSFTGPSQLFRMQYNALNLIGEQRVGKNLLITLAGTFLTSKRYIGGKAGSSSAAIYVDTNPTLPGGAPNPYFNQLYTEYYLRSHTFAQPVRDYRATAVYNLKLPFMEQRIVGFGMYSEKSPDQVFVSEFVNPTSSAFTGALVNANTLAAYQANNTTLSRNYFYRRFYLKDGDGAQLTGSAVPAGRSVFLRDSVSDGASGRLTNRKYWTPAYGIGASGSYFKGRLRSLLGWRHDEFDQDPGRDFYNQVTGETYVLNPQTRTRIDRNGVNYGGVLHLHKMVSLYANYAESVALSSGVGSNTLIPGQLTGPSLGDGYEYGLRWSFLDGRLESNWTYFISNTLNAAVSPAIPAAVQTELQANFSNVTSGGTDTQSLRSTGLEFETVANLTKNWRLMWNFATNDLVTSERYTRLRGFRNEGAAQNKPLPQTDAFLATVPDGTPIPGFTKVRTNLVTNYRFAPGALKGLRIGGGFQYRAKSYRGNFDLNRDGFAEQLWTPGYALWNVMAGYRRKVLNRAMSLNVNVNNLFDHGYYRSTSLGGGSWGEPRTFRVALRTEL